MPLPADATLDDVKIRIRATYSNPSVRSISQVVLKDGPQTFRIASLLEIINPQTQEFHHYSLKIDHIDRSKKAGWFAKPERSVRLEGADPDEIDRLYLFLQTIKANSLGNATGALHVIRSEDYAKLEALLGMLPNLAVTDKIQLIRTVINLLDGSPTYAPQFVAAFEESPRETLAHIATAARFLEYRDVRNRLEELILDSSTGENAFQGHLSKNPWIFGSEYSELLQRRAWTRDDKLDFMLRRTVDGFLEIIEIKTAFPEPLFIHDKSHESYYASAKLSAALGQVMRYVEEVQRNRDTILANDKVDTLKIRVRVIMGRDGDAAQQAALRKFNSHLHGIEVITYDQLLRIADRVLHVFEWEPKSDSQSGDPNDTAF